ncbi:ribosomal protein S18 acetylase RimI-like enzyme [Pontibacter aydingkolensis]|uniref:GNAT family N-acetyltransferase n=1 Tax=Pontibacter aydingkolensis TaxID=1911536 RepID=A0ABS7CP31_9BACT|nr:GNAT family N-acetyltransferase [Pontibacter aydingkolensis]MBW7465602.1 GNAT family N-acetyltransferase [Pontibacter aydingkolensis]
MTDFSFSFLTAKEMPVLHQTFLKAFADYLVPIQLDETQFKAKVQREGIEPSFCVAAFNGGQMVGFILTGLGEWLGKPTAYNAGTGVLPAYRGHRLTQQLYTFLVPKLRESGVECCLLEVIQENIPALKSYQSIGMQTTRSLDCFRVKKEELLLQAEAPQNITIAKASKPDWDLYQSFWDIAPTWQNAVQSIKRSINENTILEARDEDKRLTGYIIVYPKNGAIAQLAVAKNSRNTGIATALLRVAVKLTDAPALMCINIDTAGTHVISYLQKRYFKRILGQYEMLMTLV